jgi:hypothetical protein
MISREKAEEMVGKHLEQPKIGNINSSSLYEWLDDISILNFPEIAAKVLTEESFFIVHPGFYYRLSSNQCSDYLKYLDKLRLRTHSDLEKSSVLVWTPLGYKQRTLKLLDLNRDSVILVPTEDFNISLRDDLLRMKQEEFYRILSHYIKFASVVGEGRYGCVEGVREYFSRNNTQVIEDLTVV